PTLFRSHALELSYPIGTLPHGLAIAWGMMACAYVSMRLGLMSQAERERHDGLIRKLIPETRPEPKPAIDDVIFRVMRDSKRGRAGESAEECACVLLSAVGRPIET